MTLDNMTGITKGSYTGDMFCKRQLITCNRVKECNGVCPFEDALQHADKTQTMNEQHIINHDRDWIIGCIEHDGFIHTHRFDKANQIILDALSADRPRGEWIPCSERLPNTNGIYIVTRRRSDGFECRNLTDACYFDGTSTWHDDTRVNHGRKYLTDVLAWMPLPEPYRGDGEL